MGVPGGRAGSGAFVALALALPLVLLLTLAQSMMLGRLQGQRARRVLPALQPDPGQFLPVLGKARRYPLPGRPTGLILPHHLLARQCIADAFATVAGAGHKRVLILAPDHFHLGDAPVSVVDADFDTPFGIVRTDRALLRALARVPGVGASDRFYREHGILNLLPFIKRQLPGASVCAVAIRVNARRTVLDALFAALARKLDRDTLVIQSTDFSHYLPLEQAEAMDAESLRVIRSADPEAALRLRQPHHIDSVAALHLQLRIQKECFHSRPVVLDHFNSQRFAEGRLERTTSYVMAVFTEGQKEGQKEGQASFEGMPPDKPDPQPESFLIIGGDLMLGRGVEARAARRGLDDPLRDLAPLFHGAGAVLVNLEGPLTEPLRPEAELRFHFRPAFASALARAGITHAGLANNHMADQGPEGEARCRQALSGAGIVPLGRPGWNQEPGSSRIELGGRVIRLLAFNGTEPYFQLSRRVALIRSLRAREPGALIIVSIHWGQEYRPAPTQAQRHLGRAFVDAGADLVAGHHPHVIQEVERYREGLIFHSLGNLVFDQWRRPETRYGLLLKILPGGRNPDCELIPVDTWGERSGAAPAQARAAVLVALAEASQGDLRNGILSGRLLIGAGPMGEGRPRE